MRQKPTEGYDSRIADALQRGPHPMSVRELARELGRRHPHLRGTSYGGVRQYVEGKVKNPRVELLRAMADALGVRPDWLAFGLEGMTDAEERAAVKPSPERPQSNGERLIDAYHAHEVSTLPGVGVRALAAQVAIELGRRLRGSLLTDEEAAAVLDAIYVMMLAPQRALGTEEANLGPRWEEACRASLTSLLAALPLIEKPNTDGEAQEVALRRLSRVSHAIAQALEEDTHE